MAQREANPTKASYTLGDTEWKGMDTFTDPQRLGAGMAQSIQNLISDGMGSLVLRNGWQGQFTTPLGAAIYEPTMLRTADGSTTKIVFTSGGKLYVCDAGATTYTELTKTDGSSFSFTSSADVRMTQYGKYIYGVPGGTGKIFRTAGTGGSGGTTTEIVNLSAPASGGNLLTPRLRNWNQVKAAISSDSDLSTGSPSLSSSSTLLSGGSFETSAYAFYVNGYTIGSNGSDPWKQGSTGSGSGASLKNAASLSSGVGTITNRDGSALGLCVLIDQTADGMYQDISSPPTETVGGTATKVGLYLTEMYLFNNSVASGYNYSVVVTTTAYNGSTVLASVSEQVSVPYATAANDWVRYRQFADFREHVTNITKIRVSIVNAPGAPAGGNTRAMLIDDVNCYAISDHLYPVSTWVSPTPDNLVPVYATYLHTTVGNAYVGYLKGRWVKRTVSAVDVSKVTDISARFRFASPFLGSPPPMRMGLQEGSGTIYWSAYGEYDEINSVISFDVSAINATARDAVTSFYIQVMDDILSPTIFQGDPLFFIGDIADPGLMTPNADYEYLWTEWAPESSGGTPTGAGVESSGTNPSNSITTNGGFRSSAMVLNPAHTSLPTNASATYIRVWRRAAEVFTDGNFRLVAQFPTATMASGVTDTINGYWSTSQSSAEVTNAADIAFFDNTPDSALLYDRGPGLIGEVYRSGRDAFPTGATSIAVHQRRLWVGKGNTLYASWLLDTSNEHALYTTLVPDPDDPLLPIKGASFSISSPSDNEPIVSLLSYGSETIQRDSSSTSVLLVLREHSIHGVTGVDALQFAAQQFLRQAGIGALAKRAAAFVDNRPWFLSASGVMEFNGMQVLPRSMALERVLNPLREAGGSYVTAAAYKLPAMVYHNRRLFLFAPVAGGSANSVAYVYDTRTNHWVKFTTPGFTSGVSLSGGGDTQDFYCAGSDGQLYKYNGYADKATPAGSNTAISYAIQTRRHGQVAGEGVAYFGRNHPTQMDVHIFADASHTFTWAIYNENGAGRTGTWAIPSNTQKAVAIRALPTDIDGVSHEMQLSGSATGLVRVYAMIFHATERYIPRSR